MALALGLDMNTSETQSEFPDAAPPEKTVEFSRRQLVRAGLSVAPVVAVFKSSCGDFTMSDFKFSCVALSLYKSA